MSNLRSFVFAVLLFTLWVPAWAQKTETKKQDNKSSVQAALVAQDFKLNSKLMAREMPYRVVLPRNYEKNKTERYPVVYLLHGFGGSFSNWTDKTNLKQYPADFRYIIVTPEGNNGFYTDHPKNANDKYESYIIEDLIPEIDAKFRTLADREHRFIGGLSMGGYGAMKFGLKYPQMFALAGSFSGAISASSYRSENELPPGNLRDTLVGIFGAPESEAHQAND
jgi:S-formylglutathione hydrolase FrmB